jgi:hypothetical protein
MHVLAALAASISANIAEGNGRFTKATGGTSLASRAAPCKNAFRYWSWPVAEGCSGLRSIPASKTAWRKSPGCYPV